jgi:hypothetical protein
MMVTRCCLYVIRGYYKSSSLGLVSCRLSSDIPELLFAGAKPDDSAQPFEPP